MIAPAIIGGIIAGGAALGSAVLGGLGSKSAASEQAQASNNATLLQLKMYKNAWEEQAPWREAGTGAVNELWRRIQAGPGKFEESPGYQFTLGEGLKGINRLASATGRLGSGATLKAAGRYAENLASTEYDNFLRRWYQSLTPYQSLSGVGMTSDLTTGAQGVQTGANVANTLLQGGQSAAAGQLGTYNALANAVQGVGQTALDAYNYNALRNLYNTDLAGGTSSAGSYYNMPSGPKGNEWWEYY